MNAVIYARFSSHAQNEQSIEGQLHVCYEYAQRNGYKVVGEYIDRAMTGRSDDRPDFQRMIQDAKKKAFDYIIVYKLDRFARNRYDSAVYKHKLKQHGVRVLSATEAIGDNPESIILEAVLEASAEYYSADLAQKVKRGRRESAMKGKYLGGTTPFGYKSVDGQLIIDEERAPIIKYAFEQYAAGKSKREILNEINAKGMIKNRYGKPFGMTTFQNAFKSEKYIGVLEQEGVRIEGGCPAIIDKETFYKVQDRIRINQHKGKGNKAKVDYLLSGKIFCGHCGSTMQGVSGRGKLGETYHYYSCVGRRKMHNCNKAHEKKDFIEWYIVEQTLQYVLTPARVQEIARRVVEQYDNEFNDNKVAELEKLIKKIERDIDDAVEALIATKSQQARDKLSDKIDDLAVRKSDLEIDLAKLKVANEIRYTEDKICAWIKQFCKGDVMDEEFRRRIIDVFVSSVYLYDDRIIITYNVKGGKQISYLEAQDAAEKALADGVVSDTAGSYDKGHGPPYMRKTRFNTLSFLLYTEKRSIALRFFVCTQIPSVSEKMKTDKNCR